MRHRVLVPCLSSLLCLAPAGVMAAPAFEKPSLGPIPSESSMTREQALRSLLEGEAMLQDEATLGEGMGKMLEAYVALHAIDGAEARGVKELRSWLVKALETIEFMDEAAVLRAQGSYVDHPLSVMPSTWFVTQQPSSGSAGAGAGAGSMTLEQAEAEFERGLGLLEAGDIEGLIIVMQVYEFLELELGAEHEDSIAVRSFLVGLLEAGNFMDEAGSLRARGSVTPVTEEDTAIYLTTWMRIIEAEGSADSTFGTQGAFAKPGESSEQDGSSQDSSPFEQSSDSSDDSASETSSSNDDIDTSDDDDEPRRSSSLEPGSVVPELGIDLGLGSWRPDYGSKGFIWLLGIDMHWTLFRVRFFGMQLGGAGRFGRNRDKRWLADAHAEVRLDFDFRKLYLTPEFGGGYDQVAGGDTPVAEALVVGAAPSYHYGGTLGVRFGERFGMYGRAVRLHRDNSLIPNETRVRAGFLLGLDDTTSVDFAFVFTDFDERAGGQGAQLFAGAIGLRI